MSFIDITPYVPTEDNVTDLFGGQALSSEMVFTDVNDSQTFPKNGIISTIPRNGHALSFLQFFFERGPTSHHMYQPPVNNRPVDFTSYTADSGENRALRKVFITSRASEDIGSKNIALNMYSVKPSEGEAGGVKLFSLGELIGTTVKAQRACLDSVVAAPTSFEDFQTLCGLFDFSVTEEKFKESPLNCLYALASKFDNVDFSSLQQFKEFLETYNLVAKLGLDESGLEGLTDETLPQALREVGFALRHNTCVRFNVIDGQHRANLLSLLLNAIYDLTNRVRLNESMDFSVFALPEYPAMKWHWMSFHKKRINIVFATAGIDHDGKGTLTPFGTLDKDALHQYISYGVCENAAQGKNVDVPVYKQPFQEAAGVLLQNGPADLPLPDVLSEPGNTRRFNAQLKTWGPLVLARWKELKNLEALCKGIGIDAGRKNQKTVADGFTRIAENSRLFGHSKIASGSRVNSEMFTLICLCCYNREALENLKKLFVLPQPVFGQRETQDMKLFSSQKWISQVILANLGKIYRMLQKRFIFEALLLLSHQTARQDKSKTVDERSCFDETNQEWSFEVGFFTPVKSKKGKKTAYCQLLERHFGPQATNVKMLADVGLPDAKHSTQDQLLARIIISYFFSDIVDAIHEYGYDFAYPPQAGNSEPDLMMSFLNNEKIPSVYKDDQKGWEEKHSLEMFLLCWSHWLCNKLEPDNVCRKYTLMKALGGAKYTEKKFDVDPRTHKYTTPVSDLSGFDNLTFTSFLRRAMEPGGFTKLVEEGIGEAEACLETGRFIADATVVSSIAGQSTTGHLSASLSPTHIQVQHEAENEAEPIVAQPDEKPAAKPAAPINVGEGDPSGDGNDEETDDEVAAAATDAEVTRKFVNNQAGKAFSNACFKGAKPDVHAKKAAELLHFMAANQMIKSVSIKQDCLENLNKMHTNELEIPGAIRNFFWQAQKDCVREDETSVVLFEKDETTIIGLNIDEDEDDKTTRKKRKMKKGGDSPKKKPRPDEKDGGGGGGASGSKSNDGQDGGAGENNDGQDGGGNGNNNESQDEDSNQTNSNADNIETLAGANEMTEHCVSSTDSEIGFAPLMSDNESDSPSTIVFRPFGGKFAYRSTSDGESTSSDRESGRKTPHSFINEGDHILQSSNSDLDYFDEVNTGTQNPYHNL